MNKFILNNITNIGDILAIPFFALLTYYFYTKNNKTFFENILFLFSFCGLIADIFFTYLYYNKK